MDNSLNEMLLPFIKKVLPVPDPKAKEIAAFFELKAFKKGAVLLAAGEVARTYYLVVDGYIHLYSGPPLSFLLCCSHIWPAFAS